MNKRKYVRYTVVADFGEVNEVFESYREAFSRYQRQDTPKTMYGFDEQDVPSVIFSKA